MFDWIISGAARWAVLQGTGRDDGLTLLIAQRGDHVWITDDGRMGGIAAISVHSTEEEAVSRFYEALSHFQEDHATTVKAQWTDAEVAAL